MITIAPSTPGQIEPKELSRMVEQARHKFGLPALAVAIISSDRITPSEVQGVAIHGQPNEVSPASFFHIGSCSKSILAVIAAKLIEDNRIGWDTKFFDIFPELRVGSLPGYHGITLEDLFLCRAGIKAYTSGSEAFPEIDTSSSTARYDFAAWLLRQDPVPAFRNGKFDFHYSNAGYTIASLMIERAAERSYEELIEKFIANGMGIETLVGFPNRMDPHQPWGHTITRLGVEPFPPHHAYRIPYLIVPAGDLSMRPEGFARYIQLSLRGLRGDNNFITASSYQYIHQAHKGFSIGVVNSKMFGLSFSGMDGSAGTFFCRAMLIPESDLAFTIMTNAGTGTARMRAVDWLTMKIVKEHYGWWWKFWI